MNLILFKAATRNGATIRIRSKAHGGTNKGAHKGNHRREYQTHFKNCPFTFNVSDGGGKGWMPFFVHSSNLEGARCSVCCSRRSSCKGNLPWMFLGTGPPTKTASLNRIVLGQTPRPLEESFLDNSGKAAEEHRMSLVGSLIRLVSPCHLHYLSHRWLS